jgi:hypothetical protein
LSLKTIINKAQKLSNPPLKLPVPDDPRTARAGCGSMIVDAILLIAAWFILHYVMHVMVLPLRKLYQRIMRGDGEPIGFGLWSIIFAIVGVAIVISFTVHAPQHLKN